MGDDNKKESLKEWRNEEKFKKSMQRFGFGEYNEVEWPPSPEKKEKDLMNEGRNVEGDNHRNDNSERERRRTNNTGPYHDNAEDAASTQETPASRLKEAKKVYKKAKKTDGWSVGEKKIVHEESETTYKLTKEGKWVNEDDGEEFNNKKIMERLKRQRWARGHDSRLRRGEEDDTIKENTQKIKENLQESSKGALVLPKNDDTKKALKHLFKEGEVFFDDYVADDEKFVITSPDNEEAMKKYFKSVNERLKRQRWARGHNTRLRRGEEDRETLEESAPHEREPYGKQRHSQNRSRTGDEKKGSQRTPGYEIKQKAKEMMQSLKEELEEGDEDSDKPWFDEIDKEKPSREEVTGEEGMGETTFEEGEDKKYLQELKQNIQEYCEKQDCKQADGDSGDYALIHHDSDKQLGCFTSKEDCKVAASYGQQNEMDMPEGMKSSDIKLECKMIQEEDKVGEGKVIQDKEEGGMCKCGSCGHDCTEDADYCPSCGSEMDQDVEGVLEMKDGQECRECGHACKPDSDFCPECGCKLNEDCGYKHEIKEKIKEKLSKKKVLDEGKLADSAVSSDWAEKYYKRAKKVAKDSNSLDCKEKDQGTLDLYLNGDRVARVNTHNDKVKYDLDFVDESNKWHNFEDFLDNLEGELEKVSSDEKEFDQLNPYKDTSDAFSKGKKEEPTRGNRGYQGYKHIGRNDIEEFKSKLKQKLEENGIR